MEISDRLAEALRSLVLASEKASASPADRQAARRAIEQAAIVMKIARSEGFGDRNDGSSGA